MQHTIGRSLESRVGRTPIGYDMLEKISRPRGAVTMPGRLVIGVFIVFHLFHFTGGLVGFQPASFEHCLVYQNVGPDFPFGRYPFFISWHGSAVPAPPITHLEHVPDARLGHRSKTSGLRSFPESLQS